MCDSGKGETFCERKQESAECKEDFLTALEMTVGGMGLFHVAYNGYVWKALPVSSSRPKWRDLSGTPV